MNNKEIDIEYEGFTNQTTFEVWFTVNNTHWLQRQALAAVKGRTMSGELVTLERSQEYIRSEIIRHRIDPDGIEWQRVNWSEIWEYFEAIAQEQNQ